MSRINYEATLQNVYLAIRAAPGISTVEIAQMVKRSPDTVVEHIRHLVAFDFVRQIRIGNSVLLFDSDESVEFEENHKLAMIERLRILGASARAKKHREEAARLKAIADREMHEFLEGKPIYRIVCAKTAPRINTTAANSVWQLADRA